MSLHGHIFDGGHLDRLDEIFTPEVRYDMSRVGLGAFGHDFAGVVESVGEGVTSFHAGDEVLGTTSIRAAGAFAEVIVADVGYIARKPVGLSFELAAALPTVGVTALQAITGRGGLTAGQSVFINGCLGGVGRIATQIALARGLTVSGSCRDDAREVISSAG